MKRYLLVTIAVAVVVCCVLTLAWGIRPAPTRVTTVSDGTRESLVSYEYDNLHRLTRVTYEEGTQIIYEYDAVGNRTSRLVVSGQ
jgi:YD repeat-containing protein